MSTTWYTQAYGDIMKWSIGAGATNPDRGAYRDAMQMTAATKGMDYELSSALMTRATDQERRLMQLSADLNRRNTMDLMTREHQLQTSGMTTANRLSQDYLKAQTASNLVQMRDASRYQQDLQRVVNEGLIGEAKWGYKGTLAQSTAMRDVGYAQATADTYGHKASRDVGMAQAGADVYGHDAGRQASMYSSDAQRQVGLAQAGADVYGHQANLAGTRYSSDAQRDVGYRQVEGQVYGDTIRAEADMYASDRGAQASMYGSDAQRDATLGSAYYGLQGELGSAKYRYEGVVEQARAQRDVGFEMAGADRYSAAQGRAASDYRADSERDATLGSAAIGYRATVDKADIEGRYGLAGLRYGEDSATQRNRESLGSQERQIGLQGGESRATVRVQGDESRRGIREEGDQARQNIRTTGDEQRRNLAFDRSSAYRMARSGSRR